MNVITKHYLLMSYQLQGHSHTGLLFIKTGRLGYNIVWMSPVKSRENTPINSKLVYEAQSTFSHIYSVWSHDGNNMVLYLSKSTKDTAPGVKLMEAMNLALDVSIRFIHGDKYTTLVCLGDQDTWELSVPSNVSGRWWITTLRWRFNTNFKNARSRERTPTCWLQWLEWTALD